MFATITVEEAQATLKDLIDKLAPGDEVVITRNQQAVAKLVGTPASSPKARQPGTLRGSVLYMAPDFDAPLEDFSDPTFERAPQGEYEQRDEF
jgi:antitoxin (DNA-binding transcriptional repressor) of toxin-antitoxin stability system